MATRTDVDTGREGGTTTPGWLIGLVVFQALYAVAAAGAAIMIVTGSIEVGGFLRWVALIAAASIAVIGGFSILWLWQRLHRGRFAAFFLDFLLAVGAGFLVLQEVNIFNGLDAVGDTFGSGMPFLALMAVGWVVSGFADKIDNDRLKRASRWVIGVSAVALLLRIGLLQGLWTFLTRLVQPAALVPFLVAALATAAAWLLWHDRSSRVFGTTQTQLEVMNGWLFVSPNVLGFAAFFAGPLLVSLYISFTDSDGLTEPSFIGVQNYVDLFDDRLVGIAFRNILVFGLIAVPLSVFPALLLAALLNSKLPGVKFFRAIYFLPSIAGVVGVALIWKQLYNATVGYLNYMILRAVDVINVLPGVDLTAPQPTWLSSTGTALISVAIVFSFLTIGFNTVLFVAGMQGIPGSLYEAADIDGASTWTRFARITVPLLRPTTVYVVTTSTILALQMFNEPFILNAPQLPPNGPNNATLTPVIYLYQKAFQQFEQGYASAIAWALFAVIFAITLIYFRRQGEEGVLSA